MTYGTIAAKIYELKAIGARQVVVTTTRLLRFLGAFLGRKHPGYWATATAILFTTWWITPYAESYLNLTPVRNWLFQNFAQSVTNPATPRNVKLLLIDDDEYWDGDAHHRVPTDRAYIARLVRALDAIEVGLIALDFDHRIPHPDKPVTVGEYDAIDSSRVYRDETDELVRAIGEVASRRKVVLSKRIEGQIDGPFHFGSDIYQAYGICTELTGNGQWKNPGTREFPLTPDAQKNISCGYIALMVDKRRIPPAVKIDGQVGRLDSFALAIARARRPDAATRLETGVYYATYVSPEVTSNPNTTVVAHDLLRDPHAAKQILQTWPVIVRSGWHQAAYGSGDLADSHSTPIGQVTGAVLHENLAEAILSGRTFAGIPESVVDPLELVVGMASIVVFAMFSTMWKKLTVVFMALLVLLLFQWITIQLVGAFFDAFVPVLALGLHSVIDRLIGEPGHPKEKAEAVIVRQQNESPELVREEALRSCPEESDKAVSGISPANAA